MSADKRPPSMAVRAESDEVIDRGIGLFLQDDAPATVERDEVAPRQVPPDEVFAADNGDIHGTRPAGADGGQPEVGAPRTRRRPPASTSVHCGPGPAPPAPAP